MTQTNIDPVLINKFKELPEIVQKVITESGWQFKIRDIAKRNNIHADQGVVLEHEIFLIMLGFDDPKNFAENIIREGNIDSTTAQKIVLEVAEKIFAPLRKAIMESTQTESPEKENSDLLREIKAPFNNNNVPDNLPTAPTEKEPVLYTSKPEVAETRDEILSQIENPQELETQPVKQVPLTAPVAPTQSRPIKIDPYREPIQ